MLFKSISFSFSQMMSLLVVEKEYFYTDPQTLNGNLSISLSWILDNLSRPSKSLSSHAGELVV